MEPDQRPDAARRERQPAGQEVEQHHANRVDVRLGARRFALEELRGHEGRRAREPARREADQPLGQAEIGELGVPLRSEQHVGGLDVAMDQARTMGGIEGLRHLPDQPRRLQRLDGALPNEDLLQADGTRDVLHLDVMMAPVAPHVMDRDHVRVDQIGGGSRLGPELLGRPGSSETGGGSMTLRAHTRSRPRWWAR